MFKISTEATFTHEVTVCTPIDGGFREDKFKAKYRVVDIEELDQVNDLAGQQAILKRIVCGLEDVTGDDDKPLPYSDELRDKLIAVPFVRAAMFQTYLAAITKTRVGN